MKVEILRLGHGTLPPFEVTDLLSMVTDFQRRADKLGKDGWTPEDIVTILHRTISTDMDAGWLVFVDGALSGFQILCFGPSMQQGRIEAQIIAFYLVPGISLSVAPLMVEAMKRYASARGAFRIIAATQRPVCKAFERLGAKPIGTLYVVPIEGKEERAECRS